MVRVIKNIKIPLKNLTTYMKKLGWSIKKSHLKGLNVAKKDEIEFYIPSTEELIHYDFRIEKIIENLSTIYEKSEEDIIKALEEKNEMYRVKHKEVKGKYFGIVLEDDTKILLTPNQEVTFSFPKKKFSPIFEKQIKDKKYKHLSVTFSKIELEAINIAMKKAYKGGKKWDL
jgi:hypothetical protein